ncbi:MAG: valine--tRNA ligase [Clostridia bacterium]|nr:valine--tRNA ligase [Clostridia bacterium]
MDKSYQPQQFEQKIYNRWEQAGYFKPDDGSGKEHFSMVMPPPNITDQLHIGHALNISLPDCIMRYKRMQGYNVLWIPGTDHASIATEVRIIKMLDKEGLTKKGIGREEFLRRAYQWRAKYGCRIVEQLRRLGASCDWSRESFTMDDKCTRAVKQAFVTLYNKKLIYQGSKIINWCPCCKTALSDAEVEYEERASHLWFFKYYTVDGKESLTFATTRPETMLGDMAVAVNPDDQRYLHLVGKMLVVPFVNRQVPIIADSYVEKDFGTGVVKITPAHDPNDFEVGLRHQLPVVRVMNDDGTMNSLAGKYEGLDRMQCRKQITIDMDKLGQLVKIEDYKHNVGSCYRCHTTVEPIISKQWFVKMKPLAKPAIDAVQQGDTRFIPKRFEKTYFAWMDNIRDWCISRQLWWGHRIPVWYCQDCHEVIASIDTPHKCPKCNSTALVQDSDVLDTWFSSALWPFSTMGWPDKTVDLARYYPTNLLVTMYDIIFFWVARMIFSSLEYVGEVPFKDVLIHGMVRDDKGKKMSKSAGNGVDPILFIDKYGADTLRFSLLNGVASGNDMRFSADKVENTRNFMNKIWNASRFVLLNCEGKELLPIESCKLTPADKWILTLLNTVAKQVNKNMERYELGMASTELYDFVWSQFCDWYIELSKPVLYGTDEDARIINLSVLAYVLDKILKMLHPFVPFITEEIYQETPFAMPTIMNQPYPTPTKKNYRKEYELIEKVKEIVGKVRNVRAEMKVAPSRKIRLFITLNQPLDTKDITIYIEKLTNSTVDFTQSCPDDKAVCVVATLGEVKIPLGDMVDAGKEIARIDAELERVRFELELANNKLSNPRFVEKAPQALVEGERKKVADYTALMNKLLISKSTLMGE